MRLAPRPLGVVAAPILALAAAGVVAALSAAAPDRDPATAGTPEPLEAFVSRVLATVEEFEREFGAVVAEEDYWQVARPSRGAPKEPDAQLLAILGGHAPPRGSRPVTTSRHTRADVLLVRLPDGTPAAYRDVFEVDGHPVRQRDERVRELFLSNSAGGRDQLTRINHESARYNLGTSYRTINTPSFPLQYVHPRFRARVSFTDRGAAQLDGRTSRVVDFRETARPSLVVTSSGANVTAEGRLWADPVTARVHRVGVRLEQSSAWRRLVQVQFREEPGLRVLVPGILWEWNGGIAAALPFAIDPSPTGSGEIDIEGIAAYSRFRRFTVETREEIR